MYVGGGCWLNTPPQERQAIRCAPTPPRPYRRARPPHLPDGRARAARGRRGVRCRMGCASVLVCCVFVGASQLTTPTLNQPLTLALDGNACSALKTMNSGVARARTPDRSVGRTREPVSVPRLAALLVLAVAAGARLYPSFYVCLPTSHLLPVYALRPPQGADRGRWPRPSETKLVGVRRIAVPRHHLSQCSMMLS